MRYLYYLIIAFLILLIPKNTSIYEYKINNNYAYDSSNVGYGQDRCCNQGCISQVSPGSRKLVAKIKNYSDATEIFFKEDSSYLLQEEVKKIKDFIKNNPKKVTLIGYTDGCGSISYNKSLSMRRAKSVKTKINQLNPSIIVSIYAAGEISENHDPKNRKVYMTLDENTTLYGPPPKLIGDFYLVDSSGSMSGVKFESIRRSINYHRPKGSKIFIVTTRCIRHMTSYDSISPSGGTEIWYAYWYIIDKMKYGQTLVIVSDFNSKHPLKTWEKESIQKKLKSKNIKVKKVFL